MLVCPCMESEILYVLPSAAVDSSQDLLLSEHCGWRHQGSDLIVAVAMYLTLNMRCRLWTGQTQQRGGCWRHS